MNRSRKIMTFFPSKGQVAQEFFVFVGIVFLIVIILLSVVGDDFHERVQEKRKEAAQDIGFYVQGEIVLASAVHDGYVRTFTLPDESDMISYTISITGGGTKILVGTEDYDAIFYIPKVTGSIQKGENIIKKQAGVVLLNS